MSGGKPVLSSRVMGLKFMQRGREKEEKKAAEAAAEEREAEVRAAVGIAAAPVGGRVLC